MRIVYVVQEMTASSGGVATIVAQHASMASEWADTTVLCGTTEPLRMNANVRLVSELGSGGIVASARRTRRAGLGLTGQSTVWHVNGVWGAVPMMGAYVSVTSRTPLIVSDYGMLAPYFWRYRGRRHALKKHLVWTVLSSRVFQKAAVIHAATVDQADYLLRLFPKTRIEVINPGIDVASVDRELASLDQEIRLCTGRFFLFIGRLDPQKGIDILIRSFARAGLPSDWHLKIVGPPHSRVVGYSEYLRTVAVDEGVDRNVHFMGAVYGSEKYRLIREAWGVVLPSRVEAPGMVNLEVAATGTPLVLSEGSGLMEWEDEGAVVVKPDPARVAEALVRVAGWSDQEREDRGRALRGFILKEYDTRILGKRWRELYESVIR